MSWKYGENEMEDTDDEVNAILMDIDDMSDEELGAAISASYIPSVDEAIIIHIGVASEDQAVTIPELAQEGAKDAQHNLVMEAEMAGFPEKEEDCVQ